jgi:hypothetical protein
LDANGRLFLMLHFVEPHILAGSIPNCSRAF